MFRNPRDCLQIHLEWNFGTFQWLLVPSDPPWRAIYVILVVTNDQQPVIWPLRFTIFFFIVKQSKHSHNKIPQLRMHSNNIPHFSVRWWISSFFFSVEQFGAFLLRVATVRRIPIEMILKAEFCERVTCQKIFLQSRFDGEFCFSSDWALAPQVILFSWNEQKVIIISTQSPEVVPFRMLNLI